MCFIASKGNLPQQGPCETKLHVNVKIIFIFKQGQIHQIKLKKKKKQDKKTELMYCSLSFQRTETLTLFSAVYDKLWFHTPHLFREAVRYHRMSSSASFTLTAQKKQMH